MMRCSNAYAKMNYDSMFNEQSSHCIQVRAACREISARWNASQKKARRNEAARRQYLLYLMLMRTAENNDGELVT